MSRRIESTRFICKTDLEALGIYSGVVDLLNGTGAAGLINMGESTYEQLTL